MKQTLYTDDLSLFRALQDGDQGAFDALFRRYYPLLCTYGNYLVAQEDAEEIVSDVFLWLWENKDFICLDRSLRHYLLRAVHHRCLNLLAKNEAKLRTDTAYYLRTLETVQDTDPIQLYDLSRRIREAIDELPAPLREAFVMHRFKHFSHREIADRLGVSPQTVNYRIGQAVRMLRLRLRDYLPISLLSILLMDMS